MLDVDAVLGRRRWDDGQVSASLPDAASVWATSGRLGASETLRNVVDVSSYAVGELLHHVRITGCLLVTHAALLTTPSIG